MNCERIEPLLSEWIDGTLDAQLRAECERHIADCPRCRELHSTLTRLVLDVGAMPRGLEPPPTQWSRLSSRLDDASRATAMQRRPWGMALAAMLLLTALGIGWWWKVAHRHVVTPPGASSSHGIMAQPVLATEVPLPADLVAMEQALHDARSTVNAVVEKRRTQLSPLTIKIIDENLGVMEDATRQIRAALAHDPSNTSLQQMLVASHRRQLAMLQQVTLLAALQERQP